MSEREWCECERAWMKAGHCLANCEVAPPSTAIPSPKGETLERLKHFQRRMVAKTEEPELYELLGLAIDALSTSSSDDVRREALEKAASAASWAIHDVAWPASKHNYERRILAAQAVDQAIRALSQKE